MTAVVLVPTARAPATSAGASSRGLRALAAQRPPHATSQASEARSVSGSLSSRTSHGEAATAASASQAAAGGTASERSPSRPPASSSTKAAGAQSDIGIQLRAMPAAQLTSSSPLSG